MNKIFRTFTTNQGVIPINKTTKSQRFPVVTSYDLNNSTKVFPIANPKIVSNTIVKAIHKIPIFKYVFCLPFPS